MADSLTLPGPTDRLVVIGQTGDGKTIFGVWVLSKQNFHKRPWVIIDFKDEEFWEKVPGVKRLKLGDMPGKKGLYIMRVHPGQEDILETWLWKVWSHRNIGLFVDEVSLMPQKDAFKAILRQGRSKLVPVIACTQRPCGCDREIFTESQYLSIFNITDKRDYDTIKGLTRNAPVMEPLPAFCSYWYDRKQNKLLTLRPVPHPDIIAAEIRAALPRSWWEAA